MGNGTEGLDRGGSPPRPPRLESLAAADEARRRAIADALHDGPVQDLASLSIRLGTYRAGLEDANQRSTIAQFEGTVRDAIAGIRGLMLELAPPAVEGDLAAAVEAYANEVLEPSTKVVVVGEQLALVDDTTARGALSIIQQALSNVRAHAGAHQVDVCLKTEAGSLLGEVTDDGAGAAPEALVAPRPGHFGLRRMREQADALGGWVRVASAPGTGVTVRFKLPIAPTEEPRG
jgi:signal transduction histidine kinase